MLNDIAERLGWPIHALFYPQAHFYWLYLLSTAVAALFLCYLRAEPTAERFRAAFRAAFPSRVFLHPSALLDYRFIIVNHVLYALGVSFLTMSVSVATDHVQAGLIILFGPHQHDAAPGAFAGILFSLAALLAADAGLFVEHWLHHRIPLLWEFHKVHHSAEVLTPLTAERMHPVNDLLRSLVVACFVGASNGVFLYLYPGGVAEVTVAGINIFYFLAYTIGVYHLQHSHVWLVFPKGIREWLFSPALHQIHHSRLPAHRDKNFAVTFTIWDRLAGTLHIPDENERGKFELGLDEADQQSLRTLWQLYMTPFHAAYIRLSEAAGGRRAEVPIAD